MRTATRTATLALGVALLGALGACSDSDPGTHTEPTRAVAPEATRTPKPEPTESDTLQVEDLPAFFEENGVEYMGEQYHKDLSEGLCGLLATSTPGEVWRAQVEAYTNPEDAVFNVMVATAYCPEQTGAVVEWVQTMIDLEEMS